MAIFMTSSFRSFLTGARALPLLAALGLLAGCGPDPAHMAWYGDYLALERLPEADPEPFDQLAQRAPNHFDRCLATMAAANLAHKNNLGDGCSRCQTILADTHCKDQYAQALYRLFECDLAATMVTQLPVELVKEYPDSYWARAAFERLWQARQSGLEAVLADHFLTWYDRLSRTPLAGHPLYYSALGRLAGEEPAGALAPLQTLVTKHPDSPRWDEAVGLLATLLEELGRTGEVPELLLSALETRADRGGEDDTFSTTLRIRLARLYENREDWAGALEQYGQIINGSASLVPKDDALWRSADIYARLGRQDAERKALQFLVEHCPWSRHFQAATNRLARP